MDRNVKIAKELVKIAKNLVADEKFVEGQNVWCVKFQTPNPGSDGMIHPKVEKPEEAVVLKKSYNGYEVKIGSKTGVAFPFRGNYSVVDYSMVMFATEKEANDFYSKVRGDRNWMKPFKPEKAPTEPLLPREIEPYEWREDNFKWDDTDYISRI